MISVMVKVHSPMLMVIDILVIGKMGIWMDRAYTHIKAATGMRALGGKINVVVVEYTFLQMATGMRDPGRMISVRELGYIFMQMATNMRVIGREINKLARGCTLLPMEIGIRASFWMASFMAKAH